jgi:hypothetical protein
MKSFAKLFLQMYLHYATQMMNTLASTPSTLIPPTSSSGIPHSTPPNPNPRFNPTDKLMKLETRLLNTSLNPSSSSPHISSSSSSSANPVGAHSRPSSELLNNNEFEGFLLFFSKFLNYSNHYLFYHHVIQSSLQEIEQLLQPRKYYLADALSSTSILDDGAGPIPGGNSLSSSHPHHSIDQFHEIGVLNDNEKNILLLMKILKLAQVIGYLYFSAQFEEEIATFSAHSKASSSVMDGIGLDLNADEPVSPTSAATSSSTSYLYKHLIPLKTILEKNLKEKTIYFTILWILSFLKMMKPIYYNHNPEPSTANSNNNNNPSATKESIREAQNQLLKNRSFLFHHFKDLLLLLHTIQFNEKFFPSIDQLSSIE